ncbi:E2F_TDP domain-containing protein [Pseudoscourfieldia marina]
MASSAAASPSSCAVVAGVSASAAPLCPVQTSMPCSLEFNLSSSSTPTNSPLPPSTPQQTLTKMNSGAEEPEYECYKLGKRKRSYNQVELTFSSANGTHSVAVADAKLVPGPEPAPSDESDGTLLYDVRLVNGAMLRCSIYLVYAEPEPVTPPSSSDAKCPETTYRWRMVTRKCCTRGCEGRVLRPIKRYGRIGRRAPPNASPATPRADPNASPAAPAVVGGESPPQWTQWTPPSPMDRKDYKHLFVSIDEASTHVHPFHPHIQLHGARNPTLAGAAAAQPSAKKFRLLVAAHDPSDNTFLGTAVSGPIRVVANNDVPKGAAVISLDVSMPTSWKGFNMTDNAAAAAMQPMRQWDDAAVQTPRVASARRGPPPPPPLPRSMRTTKADGSEPSASAWKRARAADEEEDAAGALAALAGVATLKADTNVRETPVVARKTARRAAALSKPASAAAVPPTPNPPIPPADHAPLAAAAAAATAASGHIPPFMTMPTDAMSAMHNPAMAQLFASMFAGGGMPMPAVPPSGETSAFYFFLNMFLSRMGKAPPAPGGGQMAIPAALMPGMAPPLP